MNEILEQSRDREAEINRLTAALQKLQHELQSLPREDQREERERHEAKLNSELKVVEGEIIRITRDHGERQEQYRQTKEQYNTNQRRRVLFLFFPHKGTSLLMAVWLQIGRDGEPAFAKNPGANEI